MTRKATKYEASYRDHPKATQRCGGCTMFQPRVENTVQSGTCSAVEGVISRNGWCRYFDPKKDAV